MKQTQIDPKKMRVISHELRAPLAVIRGYASLLNTGAFGELSDKAKETLEQMDVNLVREIYLVHDFGFYLKLYFGEQLEKQEETFDLHEKIQSIIDIYSKEESKAGKAIFNLQGGEQQMLQTHPWLFEVASTFLLKYAVRGAEVGSKVEVRISQKDGSPFITIKDQNEQLEKPDEAFADPQLAAGKRSGLELFIAAEAIKKLPELEIGLLPEYNNGNTFYLTKNPSNT